ncbi:hypothetical protein [Bradyrhizobium sp. AC87j1]|uniref:hypothetical protein n=1 Tax=Bradyrhizobium sp. AC87j1 TaxID=2055894 RepID=UPI00137520E6|nr:hypothetical protein [Bradyrhizobium sp. AC87j1]
MANQSAGSCRAQNLLRATLSNVIARGFRRLSEQSTATQLFAYPPYLLQEDGAAWSLLNLVNIAEEIFSFLSFPSDASIVRYKNIALPKVCSPRRE